MPIPRGDFHSAAQKGVRFLYITIIIRRLSSIQDHPADTIEDGLARPPPIKRDNQNLLLHQYFVVDQQYFGYFPDMKLPRDFMPEFGSLTGLLLDMAQEQAVDALLEMIVNRLAQRPANSLVEIWLSGPGDRCRRCRFEAHCGGSRSPCLQRVAWASDHGRRMVNARPETRGSIRIPSGHGVIGGVCASGRPAVWNRIDQVRSYLPLPSWASRDGIVSFLGQPLINNSEILGVIAFYLRMPPLKEGLEWSRVIADHAALAIANARAIEDLEKLRRQINRQYESIREEVIESSSFGNLIGQNDELFRVIRQIGQVAPTNASVLIQGESGTGKELVAMEIHRRSLRRRKPMVKINCASIPRELWESEFFGHAKGAFTGALRDRIGHFQAADGGSLFLDEIGEIPLELQGKLLRILQDGTYKRVGEDATRTVDTRIIAATNRNLLQEIDAKRFRMDLYYRLNVFPIKIPPLRNRVDDIPLLARHFIDCACKKMNRPLPRLTEKQIVELQHYHWPGNVRELQNAIDRAVITMHSGKLVFTLAGTPQEAVHRSPGEASNSLLHVISEDEMQRLMRTNIQLALKETNGRIYGSHGAARLLGVKPTTLCARIKKYGLRT